MRDQFERAIRNGFVKGRVPVRDEIPRGFVVILIRDGSETQPAPVRGL